MLPLHHVQQEVNLSGKVIASETRRHRRLIRTRTVSRPCKSFFRRGGFYKLESTWSTTSRRSQGTILRTQSWFTTTYIHDPPRGLFTWLYYLTYDYNSLAYQALPVNPTSVGCEIEGTVLFSCNIWYRAPRTVLLGTGTGIIRDSTVSGLVAIRCSRLTI
jgi:hypothetical protein